jgi:hypothetical protein
MTTPDDPDGWPGDLLAEPLSDPLADPELRRQLAASRAASRGLGRAPLPVAAGAAALFAAVTTYAPLLALTAALGWAAGPGLGAMARFAAFAWMLGYGVPVQTSIDRISLVPLMVSALAGWRLIRAGVHASRAVGGHRRRSPGRSLEAAAGVGAGSGLLGATVAWLVSTPDAFVSAGRAALTMGVGGFVLAALGALGHGRPGRLLARRIPTLALDVARTGACAALLTLAAGAGIAGVALAVGGADAATMLAATHGVVGQAGVTVACLVYGPNVAVWGAAYLLGPGFAIGTDTVVSPGDVLIGPLPGLPVLAGLPSVPLSGLGPALLGVPVVAGICAGVLLARRTVGGWGPTLATAALAGPVAGMALQVAGFVSAGGLGTGHLARLGPHGLSIGLFATIVLTAGSAIGAAGTLVTTTQERGHPADARAPSRNPMTDPPASPASNRSSWQRC